jgi:glycosyltransferase involved in cell wall biosynthesis
VVVAGRLAREKGLDTLVDAVSLLRRDGIDLTVTLLGDGVERRALELRARATGVEDLVRFRGWVRPEAVDEALAGAWGVVAPSRWAEPLGLSALEAIARGVPVVATATGGYAETIEHGRTGLLVPNGDTVALARALAAVVSEQAFPQGRIDEQARQRVLERHDPERHADMMLTLLSRAAGVSRDSARVNASLTPKRETQT